MLWPAGTNSLWMMPLLSNKAVNSVMILDFWSWGSHWTPHHQLPFWFRIILVAPVLISHDVFQKQWILVRHGSEVSRSFHPFCFLLVCELVWHKLGTDLPLLWMMVYAVSSAINLSINCRSCASICRTLLDHFWGSACQWPNRTRLILSRFLPFAKVFEPFVNMFSAYGFPPVHLHQHFICLRCSFPQFVAELCLHVAPLRCETTSHTDYVQLASVGLHCQSHAVHAVCLFSPCLWRTMRLRAHMPQSCRLDMTHFTELFRHT